MPTDFGYFAKGKRQLHHQAEDGQFTIYDDDERYTYIYDAASFTKVDEADIKDWAKVAFDAHIDGEWPNFIARTADEES